MGTAASPDSERPPLSQPAFHILLSLAEGPLHGYAIMQSVADAGLRVGPGTIYGALHRMEESGWVRATSSEKARGPTGRRQRYGLTDAGRSVLRSEARRALHVADLVRGRAVLADDGDGA